VFPEPSIWPLLTAISTSLMFLGSIFTSWAVVYGSIPIFITMVGWFWPKATDEGGTQPWPSRRTLPLPNEAPEGAMP
jgi:cytochrome c oxidase subunit 1